MTGTEGRYSYGAICYARRYGTPICARGGYAIVAPRYAINTPMIDDMPTFTSDYADSEGRLRWLMAMMMLTLRHAVTYMSYCCYRRDNRRHAL